MPATSSLTFIARRSGSKVNWKTVGWPLGNERTGAGTGARSQVSIVAGAVAGGCDGCDRMGELVNASIREGTAPSSNHTRWLKGRLCSCCTNPLGQRIEAFTGPLACPSPKNNSLLCCERNPEPACSVRVCWPDSVSNSTTAPIASGLLLVPRSRKAMEGGSSSSTFFTIRNCGALRFLRNTSCRPS